VNDQVLDDEGALDPASFPYARILPILGRFLVEHDVARDDDLASAWVKQLVRLAAGLVP
jgi:hypothetical protein